MNHGEERNVFNATTFVEAPPSTSMLDGFFHEYEGGSEFYD